ncbi:MAG: flavodoxin family protein [Phycisphaerae bacterium]|nr:flavodoxin family protein [Phycisphaerae bacterium]
MKILAIQGSPRPEGHTQAVLDIVLDAAAQAGASTEVIQLSEYHDLSGCIECFACQQTPDAPGCVVEDDMQDVLHRLLGADVIVLATPVFCWSPSWYLKMMMDRCYCLFKFRGPNQVECLLEGKKLAAVISSGGPEGDGADLVIQTCSRLAEFSKTEWLGAFLAASVKDVESIRADGELIERARAFGRKLAS